ncbi:hypothetical protein CL630_02085 [bacterium]|nr:hypothetical protein [bacterium]|tara:strand:- start:231 stop:869 length:639 start_codon:yes stop_codon:yes gene_type:complete
MHGYDCLKWFKESAGSERKGTPLSEGQFANFLAEGTKALALIASRLGSEHAGNLAKNGKIMQEVLFKTLNETHIIDCDVYPFVPGIWRVEEHHKGGQFTWSPGVVILFLSVEQQNGRVIKSDKLRKELADRSVLNANVLDFLLKYTHLIPKEWKGKHVFFWGTVYCNLHGNLFVRYLYWDDSRRLWNYDCRSIGPDSRESWGDDCSAALRAN